MTMDWSAVSGSDQVRAKPASRIPAEALRRRVVEAAIGHHRHVQAAEQPSGTSAIITPRPAAGGAAISSRCTGRPERSVNNDLMSGLCRTLTRLAVTLVQQGAIDRERTILDFEGFLDELDQSDSDETTRLWTSAHSPHPARIPPATFHLPCSSHLDFLGRNFLGRMRSGNFS
jgi:hypothetical protein